MKPGARLLISYMDIGHERHQATFKDLTIHWQKRADPLVFLDETFLTFFARAANLEIVSFVPPSGAQCEAPEGACLLDGREITGHLGLGQTLCIMEKAH